MAQSNRSGVNAIENPLEYIECIIASDAKDYSKDFRDATLYAIVFGWGYGAEELKRKFGWTDESFDRLNKLHDRWVALKQKFDEENK